MNGELEDILDCLFLLLVDLLAVLGHGLLYSIGLRVCAVAVALHICMASISLKHTSQLDVVMLPTLSLRLAVCSHASAKLLVKGNGTGRTKSKLARNVQG